MPTDPIAPLRALLRRATDAAGGVSAFARKHGYTDGERKSLGRVIRGKQDRIAPKFVEDARADLGGSPPAIGVAEAAGDYQAAPSPWFVIAEVYDEEGNHVGNKVQGYVPLRVPYAVTIHPDGSETPRQLRRA